MREKSMHTPPYSAATWPSSDVPTPNAITGTRAARHSRTIAATSSFVSGNTTTSGSALSAMPFAVAVLLAHRRRRRPRASPNVAGEAVDHGGDVGGGRRVAMGVEGGVSLD